MSEHSPTYAASSAGTPEQTDAPSIVFYMGCDGSTGHHLHAASPKNGGRIDSRTSAVQMPESIRGNRLDDPKRFVGATGGHEHERHLTHADGWTVLAMADYTIDSRPGSHMTFAMPGIRNAADAEKFARGAFPRIWERVDKRARSATPASSAEPEGVTPSFDDAYRRLDSFATGGPDPDVEMLRRDVFALLERFDRHTPKSAQSKHVCGLQGFGALDDVCEACNENAAARLAQRSASPASETATTARPCTCHPADNPPRPCAEKYALSDCRPSADPSVTTDAETVNLPGWCLYCGGTYRTFAPGLAGCENRECVRHPYINEANAAKKAAAWRGAPESSPALPLCSHCGSTTRASPVRTCQRNGLPR